MQTHQYNLHLVILNLHPVIHNLHPLQVMLNKLAWSSGNMVLNIFVIVTAQQQPQPKQQNNQNCS